MASKNVFSLRGWIVPKSSGKTEYTITQASIAHHTIRKNLMVDGRDDARFTGDPESMAEPKE